MAFMDLTGQQYERLQVIERAESTPAKKVQWHCLCDCGAKVIVVGSKLVSGSTKSCGCYKRTEGHWRTHGLSGHYLYRTWHNIMDRCLNPERPNYYRYGALGKTVCERWQNFPDFLADVLAEIGERPADPEWWDSVMPYYTLDRIDNAGCYQPGNIRWALPAVQNGNKKTSRNDVDIPQLVEMYRQGVHVHVIAQHFGCGIGTLYSRLRAAGVTPGRTGGEA